MGSGEFDVGGIGMRSGEDFTALAELLEMRDESATKIVFRFSTGAAGGNAARHVRRIS